MIVPNLNTSQLLYSTIRIIAHDAEGRESYGTAFFFEFDADGYGDENCVPILVTNKHVVSGATDIMFLVHESSEDESVPKGTSFDIKIADNENTNGIERLWINHPGDVDLCVMPIEQLKRAGLSLGKKFFYVPFLEKMLPTEEKLSYLTAMEDIIMMGSPIGLWDTINNFPLLRRGMTASHSAIDFGGRPEGVIDIAAFPGSSGSPIIISKQIAFSDTNGQAYLDHNFTLLGILYAGPQFQADGTIRVVDIPTAMTPIASTMIPAHLGFYIKATELLEIKKVMFSGPFHGIKFVGS
jgi:hypothetical protein